MKFVPNRPYSVSERAGRKIVEIANSVEAVQDGWIYIELINGPFLYRERGTPEEYKGRPRSSDRARLAVDARKPHLCEVHTSRCRPFRLKGKSRRNGQLPIFARQR